MKKLILAALMCLAFISCKTVHIPENWLFVGAKYDYGSYEQYVRNEIPDTDDREYMTGVLTELVNTENKLLGRRNGLTVSRDFIRANDSLMLEYIAFTPEDYARTGFFFLGNGSDVFTIAGELEKLAADSGSKIYVLNYRGYGKSEGTPSFRTVFDDNSGFYDYVVNREGDIDFIMGYSLGSVSATYLAADKEVGKLVLMAPLSDTGAAFKHLKRQYTNGWKVILRPFLKASAEGYLLDISNTQKIKTYKGDLLVIHGTADETLPYKMGKAVYAASGSANKHLTAVEKGGHTAPFREQYLAEIAEFIR